MVLGRQERSFAAEVLACIGEPAEFVGQAVSAASFHDRRCCSETVASLVALELVWTRSLRYSASSELIWMMGRIWARRSVEDDSSGSSAERLPKHRWDIVADSFALVVVAN